MPDLHSDDASEGPRKRHATGPTTPGGKEKSSQNSMTHGCCSNKAIIAGESEEEFNDLLEDWLDEYKPKGKSTRMLVEEAVHAQWFLKRNTNRYNDAEQSLQEKSPLAWTEEDHKTIERFTRYRTTAERSFMRALNTLEQVAKRRHARATERGPSLRPGLRSSPEDTEQVQERVVEVEAEKAVEEVKVEPIHVLEQWVEVVIEDGRAVTTVEPSNEQLLEDRHTMKPPPEEVSRRFHFRDGIPDEYSWCFETEEQRTTRKWGLQQMTVATWLAAIENEKAEGSGHLSDTGEDLPDPKRRTWCWCDVCRRTSEIRNKHKRETVVE